MHSRDDNNFSFQVELLLEGSFCHGDVLLEKYNKHLGTTAKKKNRGLAVR